MDNYQRNNIPNVRYHGLKNHGSTCYLNSVLQVLYMTEDFREAVQGHNSEKRPEGIDRQLQSLFEDLGRKTSSTINILKKLGLSRDYKQRDAAKYFEKILRLTNPQASQIFHGELLRTKTCLGCNSQTTTENRFLSLPLALVDDGEAYRVVNGIQEYFKPSHFAGENQMYCDTCDDKSDATITCEMKNHPEVLMLLLKRFEFDYTYMSLVKINCPVVVPRTLRIPDNQMYELFAFVDHYGNLMGGHYTSTIKSQDDGTWYKFNDTSVSLPYQPFQVDEMESSNSAYLLFYRKTVHGAANSPEDNRVVSAPWQPEQSVDVDLCPDVVKKPEGEEEGEEKYYDAKETVSGIKESVGEERDQMSNVHYPQIRERKGEDLITTDSDEGEEVRMQGRRQTSRRESPEERVDEEDRDRQRQVDVGRARWQPSHMETKHYTEGEQLGVQGRDVLNKNNIHKSQVESQEYYNSKTVWRHQARGEVGTSISNEKGKTSNNYSSSKSDFQDGHIEIESRVDRRRDQGSGRKSKGGQDIGGLRGDWGHGDPTRRRETPTKISHPREGEEARRRSDNVRDRRSDDDVERRNNEQGNVGAYGRGRHGEDCFRRQGESVGFRDEAVIERARSEPSKVRAKTIDEELRRGGSARIPHPRDVEDKRRRVDKEVGPMRAGDQFQDKGSEDDVINKGRQGRSVSHKNVYSEGNVGYYGQNRESQRRAESQGEERTIQKPRERAGSKDDAGMGRRSSKQSKERGEVAKEESRGSQSISVETSEDGSKGRKGKDRGGVRTKSDAREVDSGSSIELQDARVNSDLQLSTTSSRKRNRLSAFIQRFMTRMRNTKGKGNKRGGKKKGKEEGKKKKTCSCFSA